MGYFSYVGSIYVMVFVIVLVVGVPVTLVPLFVCMLKCIFAPSDGICVRNVFVLRGWCKLMDFGLALGV